VIQIQPDTIDDIMEQIHLLFHPMDLNNKIVISHHFVYIYRKNQMSSD
jgi:hypothetical protein